MDFLTRLQLALTLATAIDVEGTTVEDAIKAGQPTSIVDPLTGGPIKTYIFGKHVAIGPIPINPA